MKKLCLHFFLLIHTASYSQAQDIRAEVMVLGSYHMHNPGADVINKEVEDVLQPKRQAEIMEVVKDLQNFAPSMVALEIKRGSARDTTEQSNYRAFLEGSFDLTRWEGHQIGFRLAKAMQLGQVYHIDEPGEFPFDRMIEWAKENNQTAWIEETMAKLQASEGGESQADYQTIGQDLYYMNEPHDIDEGHGIYIAGCQIGKDDDFPGTDVLSAWYKRNARIFTNLYRLTEGKTNEKVLLIIGAGHSHILRELIRVSPDFKLIEPNDYLRPPIKDESFVDLLRHHLDAVEQKDSLKLKSTIVMGGAYHLILPDGSQMHTSNQFYNMHVKWFKDTAWTMEMKILSSSLKGDLGTAFVEANYREPERDGKPYHHKMWITYLCEKVDGHWKVVHDHCSTAYNSATAED